MGSSSEGHFYQFKTPPLMCLDERVTCIDVSCYENYSGLQPRHVEPSRGDHLIYVELSKSSERQRPHHDVKSNYAMHKMISQAFHLP